MIKGIYLSFVFCLFAIELFGKTVRVATYNLGNYLIADRWVGGRYVKAYPKPESEKEALRKVIGVVKPDVLVVEEMGEEPFLKELQTDLRSEGLDYPYIFLGKGVDEVRRIAVLSREGFVEKVSYDALSFKFLKNDRTFVRRGLVELRFKTEGVEWALFGVHLKSRCWDKVEDYESAKQRIGEATVISKKIKERFSDTHGGNYIIMGDFNDSLRSRAVKRFLKFGASELAVVLPAQDSRGEVWTHYRKGHGVYSQIDFILVSPSLLGRVKTRSAAIADSIFVLDGSDHRMVYADVEF